MLLDSWTHGANVVGLLVQDFDHEVRISEVNRVGSEEFKVSSQVDPSEARPGIRRTHTYKCRRCFRKRVSYSHGAIASVGSDQRLEFVDTTATSNGMGETAKPVSADFGTTSICVKEHELRRNSVIDRDNQAIGPDPSLSVAPTLRKLTGTLRNCWLEPQQEVIAQPLQFMEVVALHS
jgi:hypothetical protein